MLSVFFLLLSGFLILICSVVFRLVLIRVKFIMFLRVFCVLVVKVKFVIELLRGSIIGLLG